VKKPDASRDLEINMRKARQEAVNAGTGQNSMKKVGTAKGELR
jgi:hypothetical protein